MKKKSKGYAKGGKTMKPKGYASGGKAKMPMAKDPKTGQMVPTFAMDGKGKMGKGGKIMMAPKGMRAGGAVNTMSKDMKKKSKGMAMGGSVARGSGAARPQNFRKNG